jgi:oligopeptide/dipeptide ABC transporter ATP-binding protein
MADDWPLTRLDADRPIALALLSDLQSNLWASLRHTLDLDRVTLAALWLSNLGGMVLTVVSGKHWLPLTATVGALGVALAYQKDRPYDHEAKFYGLIGSMVGQAVRVHQLVEAERKRLILRGEVPSPRNPPSGCHFHTRCPYVMPICRTVAPKLEDRGGDHLVSCHLRSLRPA